MIIIFTLPNRFKLTVRVSKDGIVTVTLEPI